MAIEHFIETHFVIYVFEIFFFLLRYIGLKRTKIHVVKQS